MGTRDEYRAFLNSNYNMNSKITLADYLECLQSMDVVDIYSLDEETTEEYFGTLGKDNVDGLDDIDKNYKVIRIASDVIVIYIGKE